MDITINIVEASSELAHREVEKHFNYDATKIYECVSDGITVYAEQAQEIFDLEYDEFWNLLNNLKQ
jgi:hypothetical protein